VREREWSVEREKFKRVKRNKGKKQMQGEGGG